MSSNNIGMIQSNTEYHSNDAVGSTTVKSYLDNAVKAYKIWKGDLVVSKSEALIMGSLIHCVTLEPHTFKDEFYVAEGKYTAPDDNIMRYISDNIVDKNNVLVRLKNKK